MICMPCHGRPGNIDCDICHGFGLVHCCEGHQAEQVEDVVCDERLAVDAPSQRIPVTSESDR